MAYGSSHNRFRRRFHVTANLDAATAVDRDVWIAHRPAKLISIKEIHAVASSSGTLRPRKITDTSAPGAAAGATVVELNSANINTAATANTTQTSTLVTGAAPYFKVGERLALDAGGTQTGLVGCVITFEFEAL